MFENIKKNIDIKLSFSTVAAWRGERYDGKDYLRWIYRDIKLPYYLLSKLDEVSIRGRQTRCYFS
jgi:hypothetical protein